MIGAWCDWQSADGLLVGDREFSASNLSSMPRSILSSASACVHLWVMRVYVRGARYRCLYRSPFCFLFQFYNCIGASVLLLQHAFSDPSYEHTNIWPLVISSHVTGSKLKTFLYHKSYPDSSSTPHVPRRFNSKQHPPYNRLTGCLSIQFWLSACNDLVLPTVRLRSLCSVETQDHAITIMISCGSFLLVFSNFEAYDNNVWIDRTVLTWLNGWIGGWIAYMCASKHKRATSCTHL